MSAQTDTATLVSTGQRAAALLVRTPRALRVLSRLLGTLFVLLVALGFAPWQQSVDGTGRVVAFAPLERQQEVDAPIEGRVTRWYVREGSLVKKGDLLLELTDNDPDILQRLEEERRALMARKDAAVARATSIQSRQRALDSSRTAGIRGAESRIAMAKERSKAAKQTVDAARGAMETARLNIERQKQLFEQGLTSQRNVEVAQLEALRTATEVERALATLQAAEGEALALQADRARVEHDLTAAIDDAHAAEASALSEEASAAAELARLEVRLARQSTMEVKAPIEGTVLRLLSAQGNAFVKAGDGLLVLVPDTEDRAVELWVAGNDMPLLSNGRDVRLQFEGWPAVQFTGWPSVAVGTFGGKVALIDSTDDGSGRFRIVIRPDQRDPWPTGAYLRQGVRVNGWVLLESVTLGYELWRRFNGFPPTVKPPSAGAPGKDK
ncbi:MAG: biotin/lipoyl-binding protein [Archangium sp.]|nr:biotin/lipoyl-binding protein [Archangium sp.]